MKINNLFLVILTAILMLMVVNQVYALDSSTDDSDYHININNIERLHEALSAPESSTDDSDYHIAKLADFTDETPEASILNNSLSIMLIGILIFISFFFLIAAYVYVSLVYMALAKKVGVGPVWIAWIPIVRYYLITQIAEMHWWPLLLILGIFTPYVNWIFVLAFNVFLIIWMWKVFERVGRPGWWSLFQLIPFVGPIVFYVLLGIAAWGNKPKKASRSKPSKSRSTKKSKRR